MKKLLKWHDLYSLKILVSFLIIFTALYPKLPSVHILRTWVYIRLEDFFILGTVIIWFLQLIRKKIELPRVFAYSIGLYWLIGFASLIFSLFFIGHNLTNFFPHIAFLSFLRRVEYMILFFVSLSTVKSKDDIRDYLIIILGTVSSVFLYGIGQKYYLLLWSANSSFFQKYPFCFPSFQTGNEEFAKGIPLCLPAGARITSTFGGSYDLAAYMVVFLPIVLGAFFSVKKRLLKLLTFIIFLSSLALLIFTAQRAAFIAYLIGSIATLILYRKKLFIIPLVVISILFLLTFSESTAKRFLATFRISSVVVDSQGKLIGEQLPENLKSKIEKPTSELPEGSAFIGLPQQGNSVATNSAIVKKTLTPEEVKRMQLAEGTLQISTVTGSFLVKKVLVYDISFTTRFQAEWPNAWRAFLRNPLLGSGYSSITLATDNDYFRALGETGVLGLVSFIGIFLILWITLSVLSPPRKSSLIGGIAYGIAGGVIGLGLNAILIDVFEASKVAENLWIVLGIGTGGLLLNQTKRIDYLTELKMRLTTNFAYITYLFLIVGAFFLSTTSNFFLADDFTWLKWAATARLSDLPGYFINSQAFFYRPLDKIITFFLYTVFSFQPQGFHLFVLLLHILSILAAYKISRKIFSNNYFAFLTAAIFALVPAHNENVLWFSGLSGVLSSTFILYAVLSFLIFRERKSKIYYIFSVLLSLLAFMSYEIAVVVPLVIICVDLFLINPKRDKNFYLTHVPFFILTPLYYAVRMFTNTFSGGGDYSYSLSHLIPNLFGNFFGYIGLFLFSDNFLPYYNSLRNNLRGDVTLFVIVVFMCILILLASAYLLRKSLANIVKNEDWRLVLFGLVFSFIALLPFLGLGNIAPRYLYLASFGICLSLIVLLKQFIKNKYVLTLAVIAVAILFQIENYKIQEDWKKASEISKNALALFRIDYEGLNSRDNIYIVNIPGTYKNVWVFPVGIKDGLWFIYNDHMPSIYELSSVEDAKSAIMQKNSKRNYIFKFDNDGNLSRVK